jgi:hypothetical protein
MTDFCSKLCGPKQPAQRLAQLREMRRAESRLLTNHIVGQPCLTSMMQAYRQAIRDLDETGHSLEPDDDERILAAWSSAGFSGCRELSRAAVLARSPRPKRFVAPSAESVLAPVDRQVRPRSAWLAGAAWLIALVGLIAVPTFLAILVNVGVTMVAEGKALAYATAVQQSAWVTRPWSLLCLWGIGVGYGACIASVVAIIWHRLRKSEAAMGLAVLGAIASLIGVAGGWAMNPRMATAHAVVTEAMPVAVREGDVVRLDWSYARPRPVVEVTGYWLAEHGRCMVQEITWFGLRRPNQYYWPDCQVLDRLLDPEQRQHAVVVPAEEILAYQRQLPNIRRP